MESIFAKIPDLGEKIFKELDSQSLVKCKEVQSSWYDFINAEKVLWIRMIQNYIGCDNEFLTAWRKVLTKAPIGLVTHTAHATYQYQTKYKKHSQISPIHVATKDSSVDLYKQMMAKLADMNNTYIFGNIHPFFIAADIGNFEICTHIIGELEDKKSFKIGWSHSTLYGCTKRSF